MCNRVLPTYKRSLFSPRLEIYVSSGGGTNFIYFTARKRVRAFLAKIFCVDKYRKARADVRR